MELGEIISRTNAGTSSFEPKTSPVHGAFTASDIAAAIASVRSKPAADLVLAKYVDQNPDRFDKRLLIERYQREVALANRVKDRIKRPMTLYKLSTAVVTYYVIGPRCRRCHGHAMEWNKEALRFVPCQLCSGGGARTASVREIARLSGMSRSKLKNAHVRCFWEMHQILSIWEAVAAGQIKRALRK
jgi:hypothetical protein